MRTNPLPLRVACGLGLFFCSVASLSAEQFGLFTYEVIGETVTITDYPEDAVGDVKIPAVIDGKPVTEIGTYALSRCRRLTFVSIPDSVAVIGGSAFASCTGLTRQELLCATVHASKEPGAVEEIP